MFNIVIYLKLIKILVEETGRKGGIPEAGILTVVRAEVQCKIPTPTPVFSDPGLWKANHEYCLPVLSGFCRFLPSIKRRSTSQ